MSVCNALSKNVTTRNCLPSGGVKARAWVGQVPDFTGAKTYNAGGALSSFALALGAMFITATGRAKKTNAPNKLSQTAEGAVQVEQSVILEVAYNNQAQANAIMDFLRAEGKTVFLETNAGNIRQYFADFGSDSFEGEDTTGTVVGDAPNVLKITLKGTESNLPLFFEAVISGGLSQLASSRAYLDALVTGAEVVG